MNKENTYFNAMRGTVEAYRRDSTKPFPYTQGTFKAYGHGRPASVAATRSRSWTTSCGSGRSAISLPPSARRESRASR